VDSNAGWHRTYGDTGWYSQTHGGGWHMKDSTWIRSWGHKSIYVNKAVRADDGFQVDGKTVIDGNGNFKFSKGGGWHQPNNDWIWASGKKGIYSETLSPTLDVFQPDTTINNDFQYDQQTYAIYNTFGHEIEKFSYKAGLRLEQTFTNANLVNTNENFSNDYFDFIKGRFRIHV